MDMKPTDKELKAEIMGGVHEAVHGSYSASEERLVGRPAGCLIVDALGARVDDPILERAERLAQELVNEGKLTVIAAGMDITNPDGSTWRTYAPVESLN